LDWVDETSSNLGPDSLSGDLSTYSIPFRLVTEVLEVIFPGMREGASNFEFPGGYVEVQQIIAELDQEISLLKQARAVLNGDGEGVRKPAPKSAAPRKGRKRHLTPEGRKRISEALRRRWAERRKAVVKPVAPAKQARAAKRTAKAAKAASSQ
jgi:hypothetical protein